MMAVGAARIEASIGIDQSQQEKDRHANISQPSETQVDIIRQVAGDDQNGEVNAQAKKNQRFRPGCLINM